MESFTGGGMGELHTPKARISLKVIHMLIEAKATPIFKAVAALIAER